MCLFICQTKGDNDDQDDDDNDIDKTYWTHFSASAFVPLGQTEIG